MTAHVLDYVAVNGRAEDVFTGTVKYVDTIRRKYPDIHFELTIGVDANVTLPSEFAGVTGRAVLPPANANSHTSAMARVAPA